MAVAESDRATLAHWRRLLDAANGTWTPTEAEEDDDEEDDDEEDAQTFDGEAFSEIMNQAMTGSWAKWLAAEHRGDDVAVVRYAAEAMPTNGLAPESGMEALLKLNRPKDAAEVWEAMVLNDPCRFPERIRQGVRVLEAAGRHREAAEIAMFHED